MAWSDTLKSLAMIGGIVTIFLSPVFVMLLLVAYVDRQDRALDHRRLLETREQWRREANDSRLRKMSDEDLEAFAAATAGEMKLRREMRQRKGVIDMDR